MEFITKAMRSGGEDVLNAILPLLKFITLSIFGLVLSHQKVELIPKATLNLLSKLVFALFLPCLIFTNLGPSITLSNLIRWWFIPFNVLISAALGCILGLGVALLCRPPPGLFRFTVITTAFSNTGNLAVAIVTSVCHSKDDNPFGVSPPAACAEAGVAYVALSQWAAAVLVYTLVYHMMEPPASAVDDDEYYDDVVNGDGDEITAADDGSTDSILAPSLITTTTTAVESTDSDLSRPLLVQAEWPGIEEKETKHCKTPLIATVFAGSNTVATNTAATKCLAEPKIVRRIRTVAERTPIQHILQPPTIASLLAIAIGVFPSLKTFVFDEDSAFSVVTDSLRILAEAMVPSVMLMLGGMLAEGPTESGLGLRTTVGIIVARLLVFPLIGIGVVGLADRLGFLIAGDKLFRFVILLQYTTPSAILLGAVASLRGYAVKEASAVLFWQHVFAVLSFSFYVVLYFKLLL